jgi:sugar-specific transcriptional regulator TrmB
VKAGELVEELTSFGLDEREARVYFHLSRLGPSTASDVAQATDVGRTEVYRVMDELESEGFVETTLERPRKFVPRPVEQVLDQVLEEQQRRLEELESTSQRLADRWPQAEHRHEARKERFSVHQGRSQIRGVLERMVETAEEEVLLLAPPRGLSRLDQMGILEALADRAAEGVDLRALSEIDEAAEAFATIEREGSIRHVDLPGYAQLVIVDTTEIALFVSLDPLVSTEGSGETVLWLNAKDFIMAQKALFDTLWSTGLDHGERLGEIESGERAERVDVVRGRWMRYDRMKEMLYRADERVRLLAGPAERERVVEGRIGRALRKAEEEGVDVRALSDEADEEGLFEPAEGPFHATVLEVDEEEVLVATGTAREPGSVTFEGEWAVWLTAEDGVNEFVAMFERRLGELAETEPAS